MKKTSILLTCLFASTAFAATVNLSSSKYICNGNVITQNTAESTLMTCKNAKKQTSVDVVHNDDHNHVSGGDADQIQDDDVQTKDSVFDKISFVNDNNVQMKCYYKNNKLTKCTK
ncbi:MAG: hypothetical protein PHC75_01460 [Burkholderiales bacterium]|nr:hypothetical protein [Burkholderiales bacterium]